MKKTVSVAEFTKQFGPITKDLVPGESVRVTSHGKVHGRYVREGVPQRQPKVNLGECLGREEYLAEDGEKLVSGILAEQ